MTSNNTFKTLVLPGVLAAVLLAGCGGGGGSAAETPQPPVVTEMPSFVITNTEAVTASVKVSNTGAALTGVQVLVSTLKTEDTSSDGSASVRTKDVILYNSSEGSVSAPGIAAGGNVTFSLKNVSFAAASDDVGSSASASACANTADTALGEVRVEVFSEGGQLLERDVPVCALQGRVYEVSVSN